MLPKRSVDTRKVVSKTLVGHHNVAPTDRNLYDFGSILHAQTILGLFQGSPKEPQEPRDRDQGRPGSSGRCPRRVQELPRAPQGHSRGSFWSQSDAKSVQNQSKFASGCLTFPGAPNRPRKSRTPVQNSTIFKSIFGGVFSPRGPSRWRRRRRIATDFVDTS